MTGNKKVVAVLLLIFFICLTAYACFDLYTNIRQIHIYTETVGFHIYTNFKNRFFGWYEPLGLDVFLITLGIIETARKIKDLRK